jgi:branched-chain amino acid transport system substrate-binding protein
VFKRIFAAVMLAAFVTGGAVTGRAQAQEPLKLGMLTTLSGPLGVLGQEQKRGLDLALAHLDGAIAGRKVVVVEVDDKLSPAEAAQGAARMIEREKVDVVTGLAASNTMLAAVEPLLKANILVIGANAGPSQLAGAKCDPNMFVVSFANEQWSIGLADYLNSQRIGKMMFVGMDYQAGWDHTKTVMNNFKGEKLGGEIYTPVRQMDFAALITQIRAAKPDAIYAFYVGGNAIAFLKQWDQSGIGSEVKLYSMGAIADVLLFPAIGDAAVGVTTAYSWNAQIDNPQNKRFVADFNAKYGRNPSQFAAFQYDAIMLLDAASRQAGGFADKSKLRAALRHADFKSVRGNFKFNSNQFPIQDVILQRVEKGADGKPYEKYLGVTKSAVGDLSSQECKMSM